MGLSNLPKTAHNRNSLPEKSKSGHDFDEDTKKKAIGKVQWGRTMLRARRPHAACSMRRKRSATSDKSKSQTTGARQQTAKQQAAKKRATRGEGTNTDPQQPASARPNPSQNLNRACPSRPNRTDYFGRPDPNQPCAPDRIGLHRFAAANNRPCQ